MANGRFTSGIIEFAGANNPGWISNLGISLSAGVFSVVDAGGTALSVSNPSWVTVPSTTAGILQTLLVTAGGTFNDDSHASSDLTNLEWYSTPVAATEYLFYLYVVNRANSNINGEDGSSAFFISPIGNLNTTPSAANSIGDTGAVPVTDAETSILILDDVTVANYTSLPCFPIGKFRMKYSSGNADWTVQTLTSEDGIIINPIFDGLVSNKAADYIIADTDGIKVIEVTTGAGDDTITLPTLADNLLKKITIRKVDSGAGNVIIEGEGAETINGQTNLTLYTQYDWVTLEAGETNWYIVNGNYPQEIQDFTTINAVGTASQQAAGHIFDSNEGGLTDLAYYKFGVGVMTTDQVGTYTLTDPGGANSPTNVNGITGSDFAASFDGGDYYTQATLLDTVPAAIAIDFWFLADDGQPPADNTLFDKTNDETGGSCDGITFRLNTTGLMRFISWQNVAVGSSSDLYASTILPNGATGWYYICLNWDTTNGKRFWVNSMLEARDPTATTLMANGTTRDFCIGVNGRGGVPVAGSYFSGDIALFRVRNAVLTQKDVDLGYSVRYTKPALFNGNNYKINALLQEAGDTDFEKEINWDNMEVARTSSYIYRRGSTSGYGLESTDKLKLIARG